MLPFLSDMQDLHIKRQRLGEVDVFELTGAVDALAFKEFSATLTRMIAETSPCIVLECSRVTYVGSAQLKQLMDLAQVAQTRGGDMKCVGLPQTIQHVATLVAMGDLMEFHEDVPQALQAFQSLPADVAQ
jgi:anti-anti-sigma factor